MSDPTSSTPLDQSTNVADLTLHYRVWGRGGTPIVLLHGLASTSHIWNLVAPLLCKDYTLIAIDQRGHGQSGKPDKGYRFSCVVKDLKGFIDSLDLDKPLIIGHSWGANVALEFAVAHQQSTRGLCLVDGGTMELGAYPGMTLKRAKEELAPPDFMGITQDQMRARASQFGSWVTPEVLSIMMNNFEVLDDSSIRARLTRSNHLKIIEALWGHKPSQLFPKVRCPVLLLPARQNNDLSHTDRRFRRDQVFAKATALLPQSQIVWLEDSVHDVPLQRPNLVASVISEHLAGGFFD